LRELKAKANGDEDDETLTAAKTLHCIFTTVPHPPSGNIASTHHLPFSFHYHFLMFV